MDWLNNSSKGVHWTSMTCTLHFSAPGFLAEVRKIVQICKKRNCISLFIRLRFQQYIKNRIYYYCFSWNPFWSVLYYKTKHVFVDKEH